MTVPVPEMWIDELVTLRELESACREFVSADTYEGAAVAEAKIHNILDKIDAERERAKGGPG